ncbi:hypothetical protein Bsp3421_001871 [Burkholderia sp. FERM BP-3421]|jgi:hypothetical protein|uniref:hypothetical protein n=1 Tax=Burkholderia sp. FERM BP-3421 TaxID=1494466 RepID=UPI0020940D90|nr:hypothetical protein [Burkholderia sp. FERM BP-3421]WDD91913.1 hypothetical protein Bsp3421_001871 [Burkholderia sp. FERM BP-3421]
MRPFIDISHVANDPAFVNLDHVFGLAGRVTLYNSATTDPEALRYLDAMVNVLDRDDFAREQIRQRGLGHAAGSALAALEYARRTIQGNPPATPFNAQSAPDRLVLTP